MPNITMDSLVTGLNQYAVRTSTQIHKLINESLEWENDGSRYRPADLSHVERNATIDDVLQPYQAEINSVKGSTTWSGVETELQDGMVLVKFEQKDLDQFIRTQLYRNRQLEKDLTEQDLYKLIMNDLIVPKLKENLNRAAYAGIRVNPATAGTPGAMLDTFTGYNKRFADAITAGKITALPTGAITGTNIFDKVRVMCDGIPSWLRYKPGKVRMSKSNVQKFIDRIIADNRYTYIPGEDEMRYAKVPGYNKTLVGYDSMEGSNRIIVELDEFPSTLVVTDQNLPALPTLRVVRQNLFTMHVYAPLRRGFGLTYNEVTFINDQA